MSKRKETVEFFKIKYFPREKHNVVELNLKKSMGRGVVMPVVVSKSETF